MSVSVIIPAYNASNVISRSVKSAIAQTKQPLEIIVVDDASVDGTADIVRQLPNAAANIKLIKLAVNSGPSRARNVGIAAAQAQWLAILDADDAWKPNRLERLLEIAAQQGADLVADNQILYDAVAQKETRVGFEGDWDLKLLDLEGLFLNEILDQRTPAYPPLKPIIRREFLVSSGIRYDESARYGEDFKLYAEMLFKGAKAILTTEAYYIYSTRIGEVSGKNSPNSKSVPRFDLLMQISDDLKRQYQDSVTPAIDAAMAKRRAQLRLIHLSNVSREMRRSHNYFRFVSHLLTNPDLAFLLFKRVIRRVIARP